MGSIGGDVKIWDTSGIDLTPMAALTVHGHITSLHMSAMQLKAGEWDGGGASVRYHRVVAATSDGDLISWAIDLAGGSGAVMAVGMLTVAERAVMQVDAVHGAATPGAQPHRRRHCLTFVSHHCCCCLSSGGSPLQ